MHGNLFSKAICQSGGMDAFIDKDRANKWGDLFLKICSENDFPLKSLNKIYKTSQANLDNPENTLNLFNVLQFRIQLAYGQKETYTRLSQKISELINEISLYTS